MEQRHEHTQLLQQSDMSIPTYTFLCIHAAIPTYQHPVFQTVLIPDQSPAGHEGGLQYLQTLRDGDTHDVWGTQLHCTLSLPGAVLTLSRGTGLPPATVHRQCLCISSAGNMDTNLPYKRKISALFSTYEYHTLFLALWEGLGLTTRPHKGTVPGKRQCQIACCPNILCMFLCIHALYKCRSVSLCT